MGTLYSKLQGTTVGKILHYEIPGRYLFSFGIWALGAFALIVFTESSAIGWTIGCIIGNIGVAGFKRFFYFSEAGKFLWSALKTPEGWHFAKHVAHHKPTGTQWWTGNGALFFDGWSEDGDSHLLGYFERLVVWQRLKRTRRMATAAKFKSLMPERLDDFESRLTSAVALPTTKGKKLKLSKNFLKDFLS